MERFERAVNEVKFDGEAGTGVLSCAEETEREGICSIAQ